MRVLRHLAGHHRTRSTNRTLGLMLAFNAGAINAGGFLLVHMYTSHMTGFLSLLADNLVLGNMALVLSAVGILWAFLSGAGSTAILVNWARSHRLKGGFALPLLLEAVLMLGFGLMGAITLTWNTVFAVPLTVLLLAYIMGLQNAVVLLEPQRHPVPSLCARQPCAHAAVCQPDRDVHAGRCGGRVRLQILWLCLGGAAGRHHPGPVAAAALARH